MKSKINGLTKFLLGVWLLGIPQYVLAQGESNQEVIQDNDEIDQQAESTPEGHKTVENKIKSRFNVNDDTIQKLRDQKMGYGEITTTLALAQRMPGGINDDNIKKITDLRTGDQKMGWGNIAKQYGVTMGELHRSMKSVHTDEKSASNTGTTQTQNETSQPAPTGTEMKHGSPANTGASRNVPHGGGGASHANASHGGGGGKK